jgi:sulfite oxidase
VIVHGADPYNAETPRAALAEHDLTAAGRFFVRNHGPVPEPRDWSLGVDGLVERRLELGLDELRALPRRELTATLQCAGNRREGLIAVREIPGEAPWGPGATGTATWGGVALADVLERAGVAGGAAHVAFVGLDVSEEPEPAQPFGASITLEKALRPEVLLAFEMNGEPLPNLHGAPLRAVVGGYIGARSVKWLQRVEVRRDPWPGWFQDVVYRLLEPEQEPAPGCGMALGEVALNADILVPANGARVPAGDVELLGYAFAGGDRHVARVDVSVDGGRSWQGAELLADLGRWAWRRWRAAVTLAPGEHEIAVRAWDSAGATQPERAATVWNPKGYVNNAWGRITLRAG